MAPKEQSEDRLGQSIPKDTQHAISVSLPSWRANVGYEEGEEWVTSKMATGYPRFFIHKTIQALAKTIASTHGRPDEEAMLFPSSRSAKRCAEFIKQYAMPGLENEVRTIHFIPKLPEDDSHSFNVLNLSAVLFHKHNFKLAKAFWQHTGEGVSSRRAEHCSKMLRDGLLVQAASRPPSRQGKGPKRYRKISSEQVKTVNGSNGQLQNGEEQNPLDRIQFIEERFGRNLNLSMADRAKIAIRRRICGSLTTSDDATVADDVLSSDSSIRSPTGVFKEDVYLYPTGMNAIYHSHCNLLKARGAKKSICFGFPYIDTLKLLEKFGPGCLFYGNGSSNDLDDLELRLRNGEKYLALFCEFPSNPLLKAPDLQRIRLLADQYDFAVVIDETVGNYLNTHVLPFADVVVSSLTKIFSGDSNCMGGSAILNPAGPYYSLLRQTWDAEYDDNYWPEDAVFMERNSRDFVSRIARINANAEAIHDVLCAHPKVKQVYYPKSSPTRTFYDACRSTNGGYGGLLSATFYSMSDAAAFYDNLDTEKGPSLGTNFTLASPFVILAHYTELEWAAQFGVESNLVRFSVGLEDSNELVAKFRFALSAIPSA